MIVRKSLAGVAVMAVVGVATAVAVPTAARGAAPVLPRMPAMAAASISLSGVSCPGGPQCLAVGQESTAGSLGLDFAQAWNGRSWRRLTPPSPGTLAGLSGVSCARPDTCVAVGSYASAAGPGRALALAWDGTRWRVLATPSLANSELLGVSCPRLNRCVAVGDGFRAGVRRTLAEAWNGSSWRILPGADTHSSDSELASVSCPSPDRCLAAGFTLEQTPSGPVTTTLAEIWDGTRWRVLPAPSPGTALSALASISCGGGADCVAVGGYLDRGQPFQKPLAEGWNGTRWLRLPVPGPGVGGSLLGISCPEVARCIAVGPEVVTSGAFPVADSWNGTRWHRLPDPGLAGATDNLISISCLRAGACIAAGELFNAAGNARPLAEEWNGRQWRLIT